MKITHNKIELHQWANSILLGIVAFFVVQTYLTITTDHERIANHETRITVMEKSQTYLSKSHLFFNSNISKP